MVTAVLTGRIIGFGVERTGIDGVAVGRMFNHAVSGQPLPKHVSTDHDPLFRLHRWLANLRVREIEEVKSVPYALVSNPFVARPIGTLRRAFLHRVLFYNAADLVRKPDEFKHYYNAARVHRGLASDTRAELADVPSSTPAALDQYG